MTAFGSLAAETNVAISAMTTNDAISVTTLRMVDPLPESLRGRTELMPRVHRKGRGYRTGAEAVASQSSNSSSAAFRSKREKCVSAYAT